jgi:hypothetical protein
MFLVNYFYLFVHWEIVALEDELGGVEGVFS